MLRHTAVAIKLTLILTVIFGLIYPLAITGIAQGVFPKQANGSLITKDGKVVGSSLIAQSFNKPEYFRARPSAASAPSRKQDKWISGGSNLGPTSSSLSNRVNGDVKILISENPNLKRGKIPVDMVTASASGFDPDISPDNAYAQVPRVAKARKMSEQQLMLIVKSHVTERQFGILGEPRVNVLKINMFLDDMQKHLQK